MDTAGMFPTQCAQLSVQGCSHLVPSLYNRHLLTSAGPVRGMSSAPCLLGPEEQVMHASSTAHIILPSCQPTVLSYRHLQFEKPK